MVVALVITTLNNTKGEKMNNPAASSGVSAKAMCATRGGVLNPRFVINKAAELLEQHIPS